MSRLHISNPNGFPINSPYHKHVRYTPLMRPVYLTFPVAGIQVLDGKYFCNESTCRVELSLLGAKSTGNFKCEVSGDAPHFKLAAKEDNMTVAGTWMQRCAGRGWALHLTHY